jgi:hypothetical protein
MQTPRIRSRVRQSVLDLASSVSATFATFEADALGAHRH